MFAVYRAYSFFFLSRAISPVLHVHTQPTFGRPLIVGAPQLVQVPRALVVRPCAHVRPRSTRWHLRWIWRCSAPREPHFWPPVTIGYSLFLLSTRSSLASPASLPSLALTGAREAPYDTPVIISRLSRGSH